MTRFGGIPHEQGSQFGSTHRATALPHFALSLWQSFPIYSMALIAGDLMPHDAFLDDGVIVHGFGFAFFFRASIRGQYDMAPRRYACSAFHLLFELDRLKNPHWWLRLAWSLLIPSRWHSALRHAYGRVHHFTDEQIRWLEGLRPKVLFAEKQRAFHESMNEDQQHTDYLTTTLETRT